ncbi:MAG TPA: hypothetical protein PK573_15675, partial [Spirochaetota bacterium]|nr:hypothetical protein [Spirochaetota bacterium]
REGGLAMVDMGDYREVSDVFKIHAAFPSDNSGNFIFRAQFCKNNFWILRPCRLPISGPQRWIG